MLMLDRPKTRLTKIETVGRCSTSAERAAVRDGLDCDGITEAVYIQAVALVQRGWQVQGEKFSGTRVTWFVIPLFSVSDTQRDEWRADLYQLGQRSPFPAVKADGYRIELRAIS
jgi:hypothetical protein